MASEQPRKTTLGVLTGPEEGLPPGLEAVEDEATVIHAHDRDTLIDALQRAEVLMVTDFRTTLLRELWPYAGPLKWIHATSAGVDALMFPELIDSEIPVTNARGIFDRSIAECVLGLMLMHAKDVRRTLALQAERRWQHRETERLDGRCALILGAGGIGRQTARLCRAFDMRTMGLARRQREADADFGAIHPADDIDRYLPEADYVVLAAPLTDQTRGLFDAGRFERMKPSAYLINIGRGPIVQTDALLEALRSEQIAGAALDVFEEEPLPADHPLWEMPNALISPHMAGDFIGWKEALTEQFVANFRRWRADEPLQNLVDKRRGYVPG